MKTKVRALLVVLSVFLFPGETPVANAADTEVGTAQVAGFGGLVAGIGTHGTVGAAWPTLAQNAFWQWASSPISRAAARRSAVLVLPPRRAPGRMTSMVGSTSNSR